MQPVESLALLVGILLINLGVSCWILRCRFRKIVAAMTSYRTDKTSRVILAIVVAYALGYGVARQKALHLVSARATDSQQSYIVKAGTTSAEGWEYTLFWPAVKLEETVRYIVKEVGSYW